MKYFKFIKYVVIFSLFLILLSFAILIKSGEIVAKSENPNTEQYFIYITDKKDLFEVEVNYETWLSSYIGNQYRTSINQKISKVDSDKWEVIFAPEVSLLSETRKN